MGQIRDRMQQDLERARYSKVTVTHYLACVKDFVEHFDGRSPLKLGQEEMRAFVDELERRELARRELARPDPG